MTNLVTVALPDRGVITVGGADRRAFLQGLISNDIERVSPERAVWAALLTPQGKYLHDFFIACGRDADGGDAFWFDCEAERLMDLGQRLSRYKLRADVSLGIGEHLKVFALPGEAALAAVGLGPEPGEARRLGEGLVFVDPRHSAIGARAILAAGEADALLAEAGFTAGSRADYERLRLPLGLPDGSRDLVVEKSILLESNFEELNGVDWQKGCYVGQELTARTKYRGLIKKRLVPVRFEGAPPPSGAAISLNGTDAGEMRSAAEGSGLALIRLAALSEALAGEGRLSAGGVTLEPRLPGWAHFLESAK